MLTVTVLQKLCYFLLTPYGLKILGRADCDQILGILKGCFNGLRQIVGYGKFRFITKNTVKSRFTDLRRYCFGQSEAFEFLMQSCCNFTVRLIVPVTDKSIIPDSSHMYEYPLIPNTLMYLRYSYYNTFEKFKQSILPFRHKSEERSFEHASRHNFPSSEFICLIA